MKERSGMIRLGGFVDMRLGGPNGRSWRTHNFVPESGRALMAALMIDPDAVPPGYAALGDDGSAPLSTDVGLIGVEHQRIAVVASSSGAIIIYEATFTGVGAPVTVREGGLFNDAVAGTLYARWLTTEFILPVGAQFTFRWTAEVLRN